MGAQPLFQQGRMTAIFLGLCLLQSHALATNGAGEC
jgi:hypothetical protein